MGWRWSRQDYDDGYVLQRAASQAPAENALSPVYEARSRRLKRHSGQANPLLKVADEIAADGDILCFDEFFVSDIGDAMILGEVMTALFQRGVTLIATSNVEPVNLYKNGLQRSRFLPAIDQLYAHCDVHEIDAGQDFRLRTLQQAELYHYPLGDRAHQSLLAGFNALAAESEKDNVKLRIENRMIEAVKVAGDVAWFDFPSICEGPREPKRLH